MAYTEIPVQKRFSIKTTDKETLAKWFSLLVTGRLLDDRAPNYLKQAIGWSYHAPYAGHDGIQLAIGQVFDRKTDHLYPYYRDLLTSYSAGLTAEEIICNGQIILPSLNGISIMYHRVQGIMPSMQPEPEGLSGNITTKEWSSAHRVNRLYRRDMYMRR